jgi:transcriptional regulator with XRE-family HTH domain
MDPSNRIAELRNDAGLTQQQLADAMNELGGGEAVTGHAVSRYETGRVTPRQRAQRLIAKALQVSVSELGVTPRIDPLAFLEEPTITPADPRVTRSQDEWRAVRRNLNTRRQHLTAVAADCYPDGFRFDNLGLLTRQDWLPDVPAALDAVTVETDPAPAAPVVDGTGPESGHVRPLADLAQPYPRYTAAVRDLDPPRLFENRLTWRLLDVDWTREGKGRLTFGDTTYFAAMDVCEALAHEMAYVGLGGDGQPCPQPPTMRHLPLRRHLGDPFTLGRRPAIPSVSTLTVRGGNQPTFLLHRRDARQVAIAGGLLHVIPTGVFQPSSVLPAAVSADFDLWRNIMRETAEELLGMPEANGDDQPVDYRDEPYAVLDAAATDGRIRVHALGVALDALTLAAEIFTVAVYEPDLYDELAADFVTTNDEGTIVNQRLPFDDTTVTKVLASGRMAPGGAGCLSLAWQHREAVL